MTLFNSSRFLCCSMSSFGVSTTSPKNSLSFNLSPTLAIIFIKCRNLHHTKNNIRCEGNINNTSVIIFYLEDKNSQRCYFAWENLKWGFCDVGCSLFIHFCSSFCCCSSFLLLLFIHCVSMSFLTLPWTIRRVFPPTFYFQPSPSQSDSRHFLNLSEIFFHSFTASATVLSEYFLPTGLIYLALLHWHFTCAYQGFLGACSSPLRFAGLHTDPRNTGPAHLFVWFTVIHNLHIQKNSFLNSVKYYHELLVVKGLVYMLLTRFELFSLVQSIC